MIMVELKLFPLFTQLQKYASTAITMSSQPYFSYAAPQVYKYPLTVMCTITVQIEIPTFNLSGTQPWS